MAITAMIAGLLLAGQVAATPANDVAFDEMAAGADRAAIEKIEANSTLSEDDPARLINLGIAYARQGREDLARDYFNAVVANPDRYQMETAEGKWVDSRNLGRQALAMLNRGEFSNARYAANR